jgi:Phospholipase_D-nuclease N-terminal
MRDVKRKKWSEMSVPARVGSVVIGLIQVGLLLAALADIRKRPAEQINGSKALWTALVFINTVGPIAYFVKGRKHLPAAIEPAA